MNGVGVLLRDVPLHVDHPLGIEIVDHGAVGPVDAHPPAPGDIAHDLVARQGVAALAEADHDVVDPRDGHARRFRLAKLLP